MLNNKIIYLNTIFRGSTKKLTKYIESDPQLIDVDQKLADNYVDNLAVKCITFFDENYPNKLKATKNPPWVIYYKGDVELLKSRPTAIMSDHYPTSYGKFVSVDIVKMLSTKQVVIVSKGIGVAADVEEELHREGRLAIYVYNKSIEKVECPINSLIISAVVPEAKIENESIQNDNIFIPVVSSKLIVVEASCESSINKIVDIAIDFNVQVYGVPGNVYSIKSLGVNNLIQDGANVLNIKLDL